MLHDISCHKVSTWRAWLITPRAAKGIEDLPLTVQHRIQAIVVRMADWPNVSGAKPLRNELSGRRRVRTGDYRVQFFVRGGIVYIEKVGHRDGFCDE